MQGSDKKTFSHDFNENEHGEIPLYQAALHLMEEVITYSVIDARLELSFSLSLAFVPFRFQVCNSATEYARTYIKVDEARGISGSEAGMMAPDQCEVYVFGSNSSHQLAEGNVEKMLQPKLAGNFSNVIQVLLHCTKLDYFTNTNYGRIFIKVREGGYL